MSKEKRNILEEFFNSKNIVVLTGAGISAESGIPTFRGEDGYWVHGSKNYHPMELATARAFREEPDVVWEWYHHRRNVYAKTEPNAGHYAIAQLEMFFKQNNRNFTLVTQNVDGLHLKAGSSQGLFQIHGNLNYMRCYEDCSTNLTPIPEGETGVPKCPNCGENMRPHVLWFDEFYDEDYYKFRSVLELGSKMDALLLVGTTLQTNLPMKLFEQAYFKQAPMIEIDINPLGLTKYGVLELQGKSGDILPEIVKKISKGSLDEKID